jgi:hypothetical protein
MSDIFISYSKDDRARVMQLVQYLEAQGLTIWWDQHLDIGTTFRATINQQLQRARLVLVVWSNSSISSRFVHDEADLAMRQGNLLPVRIDNVDPPLGYRQLQTTSIIIKARISKSHRITLERLVKQIRSTLNATNSTVPATDTHGRSDFAREQEFAAKVSAIYENLGYRVLAISLAGAPASCFSVSRHLSGSGMIKALVVCVFTSRDVQLIQRLHETLLRADSPRFDLIAFILSEQVVKEFALPDYFALPTRQLTLEQLENETFSIVDGMNNFNHEYRLKPIWDTYIPIRGSVEGRTRPIGDVANHIARPQEPAARLMIVYGDFGSGKTTIMERAFYLAASDHLRNPSAPIPVLLRMRGFRHHPDLWDFVSDNLRSTLSIRPSERVFMELLMTGRFLVLLDGFDEIHTGATAEERANYLSHLLPLVKSPSRCVLASRPTFFQSLEEMVKFVRERLLPPPEALNIPKTLDFISELGSRYGVARPTLVAIEDFMNCISLLQLNRQDILTYLKSRQEEITRKTNKDPDLVLEILEGTYDLKDLMTRPLLLEMIVETICLGKIDLDNAHLSLGPSTLYENYTQLAVYRDNSPLKDNRKSPTAGEHLPFLAIGERLEVCRNLALEMAREQTLSLSDVAVERAIKACGLS